MFEWIKNIFKNPKSLAKLAIDALDAAVPFITNELEKRKEQIILWMQANQSGKVAQLVVDKVQWYLRDWAKLPQDVPPKEGE